MRQNPLFASGGVTPPGIEIRGPTCQEIPMAPLDVKPNELEVLLAALHAEPRV